MNVEIDDVESFENVIRILVGQMVLCNQTVNSYTSNSHTSRRSERIEMKSSERGGSAQPMQVAPQTAYSIGQLPPPETYKEAM